jgi:hypothetical protein
MSRAVENGVIVFRRSCRDEVFVYYDLPGDRGTWDDNVLLIARERQASPSAIHRMLAHSGCFPNIYEKPQQ